MKILKKILKGTTIGLAAGLVIGLVIFVLPAVGCIGDCTCGLGGAICGAAQCSTGWICGVDNCTKGDRTCAAADAKCDSSYEQCQDGDIVDTDFGKPVYIYSLVLTVGIGAWIGSLCGIGVTLQGMQTKKKKATSHKSSSTPRPVPAKPMVSPSVVNICGIDFDINTDNLTLTYDQFVGFNDYDCLTKFNNLKTLGLPDFDSKYSYIFKSLKGLEKLVVPIADAFDIKWLLGMKHLKRLMLPSPKVDNLSLLEQFPNLEMLVASMVGMRDTLFLKNLMQMNTLDISMNEAVVDISPLRELYELEDLNVSNTGIVDYSPLYGLQSLKSLHIGCIRKTVPEQVITELRAALPSCEIEIEGN